MSRTILIGLLTAAPLIITWLIVSFLLDQLSHIGQPWVRGLAYGMMSRYPALASLMLNETVQYAVAVLVVLVGLFVLGWATGRVIGQRLIRQFENFITSIPFVDSIYRATKRFLSVAGATPGGEQRVVLIDFPSPNMKTIGLVTKRMRDATTGEGLLAVYIPTAPNPTSGYVEIVPVQDVVFLDMTFDQAMSFIVTGGSNAPDIIDYRGGAASRAARGAIPTGPSDAGASAGPGAGTGAGTGAGIAGDTGTGGGGDASAGPGADPGGTPAAIASIGKVRTH